jgi:hypothetical protein
MTIDGGPIRPGETQASPKKGRRGLGEAQKL